MDNDGDLDIITASIDSNNYNGSFTMVYFDPHRFPRSVDCADMNGDGWTDIVFASFDDLLLRLAVPDKPFEFHPIVTVQAVTQSQVIIIADMNSDGWPDIVTWEKVATEDVLVFLNFLNTTSTFDRLVLRSDPGFTPLVADIAVDDMDRDGALDVVVTTSTAVYWIRNMHGNETMFSDPILIGNCPRNVYSVDVGDVTGDGMPDVAAISYQGNVAVVFANNGSSSFDVLAEVSAYRGFTIVLADVNLDGNVDVTYSSYLGDAVMWCNNRFGNGTFDDCVGSQVILSNVRSHTVADIDGYGMLDIVGLSPSLGTYWLPATPVYGPLSSLESNVTTLTGFTHEDTVLSLGLRDVVGDPLSGLVSPGLVDIGLRFGEEMWEVTDKWIVPRGTYIDGPALQFTVNVAEPGSYTITMSVYGEPVANSPSVFLAAQLCEPGEHVKDNILCVPCEKDTFSEEYAVAACEPCPLQMTSPAGSDSYLNCICTPGYWFGIAPRAPGRLCELCPAGGVCAGGDAVPVAAEGFFEVSPGSAQFVECPREGSCAGANRCQSGYTGYLCATCSSGYYSATAVRCRACPKLPLILFASTCAGLGLVAVVVAIIISWSVARSVAATPSYEMTAGMLVSAERIRQFRTNLVPTSVSMVLVAFQIVAMIAQLDFSWTRESQAVLNAFLVVNIDTSLFASECAVSTFHAKYVISLLLPLVLLILVAVVLVLLRAMPRLISFASHLVQVPNRVLVDAAVFVTSPLLYIPVSRAALVLFGCVRQSNGKWVLTIDRGVECFDQAWWRVAPFGLFVVGVFVIGIPVYFGLSLFKHRTLLFEAHNLVRFGPLHRLYRRHYYWGEVANLAKRLGLVMVAVFLTGAQLLQLAILVVILVMSVVIVSRYSPYYYPLYNTVDLRLGCAVLGLVMVAVASYSERRNTRFHPHLLAATIVFTVVLLAVSLHAIFIDVQHLYKTRQIDGYAVSERQRHMRVVLETELLDMEASAAVRAAADAFLMAMEAESVANDVLLGDIKMDEIAVNLDDAEATPAMRAAADDALAALEA
ncbi:uncharacterized protein AMSG_08817 [Thecamonas trahens ATCC 50062]|uniref:DUF7630 domain-containing protein n=1 Tax=Thecamonas trahens ATCC 50062 TaxID=461836 RepID=A0A0L0DMQ5_THETB|nr:hypothetical protein AMSG_08817 [Thecamonas trahens ATCC 50062]KNC53321.1 hypothetical protein AMSG_08817 [Thecamonas trahens ATCC 50062]|eukprot:XP_013754580.1 hypothetical protein AMSG_08817 [Thecamonas trahens ATCC 50062]